MAVERIYRFGPFSLDAAGGLLFRDGKTIPLAPKVAATLVLLVENAGKVVDKEELLRHVWADEFVEEGSLTRAISVLRKSLEGGGEGQEYIATISKRGYRFVMPVRLVEGAPAVAGASDTPKATGRPRIKMAALALAISALTVASYFTARRFSRQPTGATDIRMIAVLPFQNLTGDPGQEFVADGLTEEMITQMGGLNPKQLGVIARTSAMTYKGSAKPVSQIGRELGVDYVLEGSIRRWDKRVRISAQLVQVQGQTHVWAANYDRQLGDTLALENEVSRAVARQIQVTLAPLEETRRAATRPVNPDVYELYLLGRYHWNKRTDAGLKKAIEYFQQAIDRDPGYAQAYAGLADSYVMSFYYGSAGLPKEYFPRAKAAAERALELDEQLSEAHATSGIIKSASGDLTAAEREYKRALELNPNYATAHQWYAFTLLDMGRQEEGISEIERARELDPLSLIINSDAGWILYYAHRPDAAFSQLRKALELDPNFVPAHLALARVYALERKFAEAIAEAQKASDLSTIGPETLAALGYAYAVAGKRARAQGALAELRNLSRQRHVDPCWTAVVYAGLGERDRALEELDRAYAERTPLLLNVKMDPAFDSLHLDPRFKDLFHRIGIPP